MTTRRRSMGLGLLAASAFSLAVFFSGEARAADDPKPPQYAVDFKEQVRVAVASANEIENLCGSDPRLPERLQKPLLDLVDKLLSERPSHPDAARRKQLEEQWMESALAKLVEVRVAESDTLPNGTTADEFAAWLSRRKTAIKEAKVVDGLDEFGKKVCPALCKNPDPAKPPPSMDVCALATNEVLANAAVAVDSARLSKAFDYAKKKTDTIEVEFEKDATSTIGIRPHFGMAGAAPPPTAGAMATTAAGLAAGAVLSGLTGATGIAAATPFLSVAFEGLAKLIADRAKQEAIGWALDTAGGSLCGKDVGSRGYEQKEIVEFWMPGLCSLASQKRLSQYGAGAELLESLKNALVHDTRGWPGAFGGLAMGAVFWADVPPMTPPVPSMFRCSDFTYEQCRRLEAVRHTTAERLTSLLDGASPLPKLAELGSDYDRINRHDSSTAGQKELYSNATQIIACGLSIPHEVDRHNRLFQVSLPNREQRAHAAALAALVKAEACFTMFGRGIEDSWRVFSGDPPPPPPPPPASPPPPPQNTALNNPHGIERINTLIRLEEIGASITQLAASWEVVEQATLDYAEAVKTAAEELSKLRTDPPELGKLDIKDPEALKKYLDDFIHSAQVDAQRKHLAAALALAKASLGLGRSGIALIRSMDDKSRLPGLFPEYPKSPKDTSSFDQDFRKKLQTVDAAWARVELQIDALSSVTKEDWSALAAQIFASLRANVTGIDNRMWGDIEAKVAKHTALILAILNAKDGEEMARALDAVASPPGGWRMKGLAGEKTFSIVAHPGVFLGGELRRGPYGVVFEKGNHAYPVAPTLTMPVGVEFAWGSDCDLGSPYGVFLSLLDPAAFLQYDATTDARLPGPSVKTVLAPGIGFRAGIKNSPFSVMPFFTYRPGFRQWDAALNGSGADAYQLGLALTVDVTLFHASFKKDD